MDNQKFESYRIRLLAKKKAEEDLIDTMRDNGLSESLTDSISEFSAYDNHPADVATETFERSKDLALLENSKRILDDITVALARLDQGIYGKCAKCGREIEVERLDLLPQTTLCAECGVAEVVIATHRPLEEDVHQVFTGIFEDQPDSAAYDGEDAWQEVDRYGTSNAVGDVPGARTFEDAFHHSDELIGYVWPEEQIPVSFNRSKRKHLTSDKIFPKDK